MTKIFDFILAIIKVKIKVINIINKYISLIKLKISKSNKNPIIYFQKINIIISKKFKKSNKSKKS